LFPALRGVVERHFGEHVLDLGGGDFEFGRDERGGFAGMGFDPLGGFVEDGEEFPGGLLFWRGFADGDAVEQEIGGVHGAVKNVGAPAAELGDPGFPGDGGIDAAGLEGGAGGIGVHVDEGDVGFGEAGGFERQVEEDFVALADGDGDFPALEAGDGFDFLCGDDGVGTGGGVDEAGDFERAGRAGGLEDDGVEGGEMGVEFAGKQRDESLAGRAEGFRLDVEAGGFERAVFLGGEEGDEADPVVEADAVGLGGARGAGEQEEGERGDQGRGGIHGARRQAVSL